MELLEAVVGSLKRQLTVQLTQEISDALLSTAWRRF